MPLAPSHPRLSAPCAIALGVLLFAGCTDRIDHGVTPCLPQTCDGCCNAAGQCVTEPSVYACGLAGAQCAVCDPSESCVAGACTPAIAPPDAGTDGGAGPCGPSNCAGCCSGDTCVLSSVQSSSACGSGGTVCQACSAGATCESGTCRAPLSCDLRTSFLVVGNVGRIDFGNAAVGVTSRVEVELWNAGTAPCTVSAPLWEASADRNAFSFGGTSVGDLQLQPSAREKFPVTFTPYAERAWTDSANAFTFVANDAAASQCASGQRGCRRVVVTGTGVASALLPSAPLFPSQLSFGGVAVGCESGWRQVLLVNESAQALDVTSVQLTGGGFELSAPAAPLQVPAWGTVRLGVRFVPPSVGDFAATLSVTDALRGTRSVALSASGQPAVGRTEAFFQRADAYTDALFVVHNAPSMTGLQEELANAATQLVQAAQSAGGAYRLGVITSDATQANAGRLQGSPRFVTSGSTPSPAQALAQNVRVGTRGAIDQSLEATRLALLPPNATDPLRNGGYLRPEARLAVVVLSDSAENSAAPVADYAQAIATAVGQSAGSDRVRFWALSAGGCQTGSRYLAGTALLGGGCRSLIGMTVATALQDVAQDIFAPTYAFTLQEPLDASQPVAVTVDGAPVPSAGYLVVPQENAVRFQPGYLPEAGQQIDVTYAPLCHP